jgi:nuclear GTP-binding protein
MPKRSEHGKAAKRKKFNARSFKAKQLPKMPVNSKSNAATNPYRKAPAGSEEGSYRTKAKIKLLNIYTKKADKRKMKEVKKEPARIEPDRKWFGNTRVLAQKEMQSLRSELEEQQKKKDPYTIVINKRKLPMQLLSDPTSSGVAKILAVEPFEVNRSISSARRT